MGLKRSHSALAGLRQSEGQRREKLHIRPMPYGSMRSMGNPRLRIICVAATLLLGVAGCSGSDYGLAPEASTPSVAAPTTTQRVYLATALACSKLEGQSAQFTPLKVAGPGGYSVTVQPAQDCKEQQIFNSYVYDVPMPPTGTVTITPGNQPVATVDASKASSSGAVTVFYAREGEGKFKVTTTSYSKDDAVSGAM